jgi:hypothetical protein
MAAPLLLYSGDVRYASCASNSTFRNLADIFRAFVVIVAAVVWKCGFFHCTFDFFILGL